MEKVVLELIRQLNLLDILGGLIWLVQPVVVAGVGEGWPLRGSVNPPGDGERQGALDVQGKSRGLNIYHVKAKKSSHDV